MRSFGQGSRLGVLAIFAVSFLICAVKGEDPGLSGIGTLGVRLLYGTDGDPALAGSEAKPLSEAHLKMVEGQPRMKFQHFRSLGTDQQKILRAYENWAAPLKPSKEILISFEPRHRPAGDKIQLNLEYWQGGRKMLSTDPVLTKGRPLYLMGPKWREGRLILEVTVIELLPRR